MCVCVLPYVVNVYGPTTFTKRLLPALTWVVLQNMGSAQTGLRRWFPSHTPKPRISPAAKQEVSFFGEQREQIAQELRNFPGTPTCIALVCLFVWACCWKSLFVGEGHQGEAGQSLSGCAFFKPVEGFPPPLPPQQKIPQKWIGRFPNHLQEIGISSCMFLFELFF